MEYIFRKRIRLINIFLSVAIACLFANICVLRIFLDDARCGVSVFAWVSMIVNMLAIPSLERFKGRGFNLKDFSGKNAPPGAAGGIRTNR